MTNVSTGDLAMIVRNNIDPSNDGAIVIVQSGYPHTPVGADWIVLPQRPVIAGTRVVNGVVQKETTVGPLVIGDGCMRRLARRDRISDGARGRGDVLRPPPPPKELA